MSTSLPHTHTLTYCLLTSATLTSSSLPGGLHIHVLSNQAAHGRDEGTRSYQATGTVIRTASLSTFCKTRPCVLEIDHEIVPGVKCMHTGTPGLRGCHGSPTLHRHELPRQTL